MLRSSESPLPAKFLPAGFFLPVVAHPRRRVAACHRAAHGATIGLLHRTQERIAHGPHRRTRIRRRIPAVGLPRRPRGNTARRSRRHPGDLRREPPHPRGVRRLRGRRVPGGGAGALRPIPEGRRLGLHAGGHRARTRVARPCGNDAGVGRHRRCACGGGVRREGRRGRVLLGRAPRVAVGARAWTAWRARSPTTAAECPTRSARRPVARSWRTSASRTP